ncbi:MAG: phosphoglycerate dehydrogenase [Candidatus Levybacteria bacterium]|nr:phosphoglycerate dehydrogenase [Candidatus Levybacteria bacterium]
MIIEAPIRPTIETPQAEKEVKQSRRRLLICDASPIELFEDLKNEGFEIDYKPEITPEELRETIREYTDVLVRSRTKITAEVIEAATNLKTIGRLGAGVDNIDTKTATEKGIIVWNTPGANSVAAAEHAFFLYGSLLKNIPQSNASLKTDGWKKAKEYTCEEARGKTALVVGLGDVGTEFSKIAIGAGMKVIAYDPYATTEHAEQLGVKLFDDLDKAIQEADCISVHAKKTPETENLLNEERLKKVKPGVKIINAARGGIVDEKAVLKGINEGRIGGAAFDVFVNEPHVDPELLAHDKVVCTAHLGGSTIEAQEEAAKQAVEALKKLSKGETFRGVINMPRISERDMKEILTFSEIASSITTLARNIIPENSRVKEITVNFYGNISGVDTRPLTADVIRGYFSGISEENVNIVSAETIARRRGLIVKKHEDPTKFNGHDSAIKVTLKHENGETTVTGARGPNGLPQVISINDYPVTFPLIKEKHLLLVHNENKPLMVGYVGIIIGKAGVNISTMDVGESTTANDRALMALLLDSQPTEKQLNRLRKIKGIISVQPISLSNRAENETATA